MPSKVRNDRGGLLRQSASWPKHQAHEDVGTQLGRAAHIPTVLSALLVCSMGGCSETLSPLPSVGAGLSGAPHPGCRALGFGKSIRRQEWERL